MLHPERLVVVCKKTFQGPQDYEHRKSIIEPRFTFASLGARARQYHAASGGVPIAFTDPSCYDGRSIED